MTDPLNFRIKKKFDRYIHDPIAAIIAIPLFLILKLLPYKFSPIKPDAPIIPIFILLVRNFNVFDSSTYIL